MKLFIALLAAFAAGALWEDAVLYLTGASSLEELSANEVERFSNLREHPLHLNSASEGRLLSSGLFTPYQAAAIIDYRQLHGDILSFSELSLVDGIPVELAEALRHFVSLDSRSLPGKRRKGEWKLSGEMTGRVSGGTKPVSAAAKSCFNFGERAVLSFGSKSFSAAYFGKSHLGSVVIGDFNARFGQGLVQWSGFSLSGFNSISAFCRNGSGISPCCSFSADHPRGIAANLLFGRWSVDLISTRDGLLGANLLRVGRNCEYGAAVVLERDGAERDLRAAANFKAAVGQISLFGELGGEYDGALSPMGVLGAGWNIGYQNRLSVVSRYSGKWVNAIGYQNRWMFSSLEWDASEGSDVVKLYADISHEFHIPGLLIKPALRWQEKLTLRSGDRNLRSGVRADFLLDWGKWKAAFRCDAVECRDWAFLWYCEGGFTGSRFEIWCRACVFKVDNWDDRIYVYERDVPGAFNVPACYGRGLRSSFYSAFRPGGKRLRHKLCLRFGNVFYFVEKQASTDLRLQYCLSF